MARRHRVAGRSGQREREESDPPARDGNVETMANLKQFVHEMKKSRGRAVEMRLAVLVSVAVALKVFYSERLITSSVAHSVFFFLLVAIVIIVLTTWLDYFPSRLESIKMRSAGGQGLPLACLFPPLVCTAVMCCIADHRQELLGLLSLYLVLCCTVTLATLLPTVLYSAPYPNSIVVYNLLLIVLVFIINGVLRTPLFPLLTHSILYSLLVPFLIYSFPDSFTLCEVSLISQGVSLLITDCTLVVASKLQWYTLDSSLILDRSEAILFLELGVTGFVLCCFIFSFCLYKLASTDDKFYIHIWSLLFLQLSFLFAFFVLLPCLQMITGKPPIHWLFRFLLSSKERVYLLLYWLLAVGVAGFIVLAQSIKSSWRVFSFIKSESPSSLWMRKWFHLLALAVYLPGIALDPTLLSVASSLVTVAFITIELIRLFRIWPLGESLHQLLIPFTDSRDSGILIVTHTYLLVGFSLPVWLYPLKDIHTVSKLSMYAGVLSLGVGDSIAAVSGTLVGRHKWPGTHKTLEGTIMSVMCQFIVAVVIIMCDSNIPQLSQYSWLILGSSIILGAAMEAYTHQIDNLILGVFQFTICIAFL